MPDAHAVAVAMSFVFGVVLVVAIVVASSYLVRERRRATRVRRSMPDSQK